MRGDARKRLNPGAPADVLLARLEVELSNATLALEAGRIDAAVRAMESALELTEQMRGAA